MVKTICTCDRCGKTFDEVNSKTIKIVPARAERKKKSQILKKKVAVHKKEGEKWNLGRKIQKEILLLHMY